MGGIRASPSRGYPGGNYFNYRNCLLHETKEGVDTVGNQEVIDSLLLAVRVGRQYDVQHFRGTYGEQRPCKTFLRCRGVDPCRGLLIVVEHDVDRAARERECGQVVD